MTRNLLLALSVALSTALCAAGCDRAQLLAPTGSELSLTAASTVVPSDGSTAISALVVESAGTPVQNGTTVRFTTNLGRIEPAEAQTRNGVATATYHADGASGVATIRATSGGTTAGDETLEILVGAGAIDNVALRVNPSSVPPSGGTVTVSARVLGENGQPIVGIPVAFTTSAGTLSATTAITDANGDATVQLTTNRQATVTARAGGEADTIDVEIAVAGTVSLTATAGSAGAPTSLTVTPATGTAPRVSIRWGDGESTDLGVVSAATTVTHVYEAQGIYTITATAVDNGETNATSTTVTVTARPSPTVTASPNPVADGATVTFTVTPNSTLGPVGNVTINFGDGTSAVSLGAPGGATQVQHSYGDEGTYTVIVTQTDAAGNESTATVVVTVT